MLVTPNLEPFCLLAKLGSLPDQLSLTFKGTELNYPVHEKEMLAIIRVLKRWRSDLIGTPFLIYTDHKTLENFEKQKELLQ